MTTTAETVRPLAHGEQRDRSGHCICQACKDKHAARVRQRYRALAKPNEKPGRWPVCLPRGRQTWLLARSCIECGVFKMAENFQRSPGKYGSNCSACRWTALARDHKWSPERTRAYFDGKKDEFSEKRAIRYRENRDSELQRSTAHAKKLNEATIPSARRSAESLQWTGPELELVATRDDLTVSELASMLGRTYYAVTRKRCEVRSGKGMEPIIAGV